MVTRFEAYVFYFDLIGFGDDYLGNGQETLTRLRNFHKESRRAFCFRSPNSYVVTLFDNVWCRVSTSEVGTPSLLFDYAGEVMNCAQSNGFSNYFGAITKGIHEYDPYDRILVGKKDFEDLTEQHIDITSEPHIRAALAEKWSKQFQKVGASVWVSEEVSNSYSIQADACLPDSKFVLISGSIKLEQRAATEQTWPFGMAHFQPIGPKHVANKP